MPRTGSGLSQLSHDELPDVHAEREAAARDPAGLAFGDMHVNDTYDDHRASTDGHDAAAASSEDAQGAPGADKVANVADERGPPSAAAELRADGSATVGDVMTADEGPPVGGVSGPADVSSTTGAALPSDPST